MLDLFKKLIPPQGLPFLAGRQSPEIGNVTLRNGAGGWWLLTPDQYHHVCRVVREVMDGESIGPEFNVLHDSLGKSWKLTQDQYYEFIEIHASGYLLGEAEPEPLAAIADSDSVDGSVGDSESLVSAPDDSAKPTSAEPTQPLEDISAVSGEVPVAAKSKSAKKSRSSAATKTKAAARSPSPTPDATTNPNRDEPAATGEPSVLAPTPVSVSTDKTVKDLEQRLANAVTRAEEAEIHLTDTLRRLDEMTDELAAALARTDAAETSMAAESIKARDAEKKAAAATKRADNYRNEANAAKAGMEELRVKATAVEEELTALRAKVKALLGD